MYSFEKIADNARVWIYQSNKAFTVEEEKEIIKTGRAFVAEWTAHGKDLMSTFDVVYRQFIIIALDEAYHAATGCSIDSSFRLVKQIESTYEVDLLDKMNIAYRNQEGKIAIANITEFRDLIDHKKIDKDTIVFNNLVQTRGELHHKWETRASDSWHNQWL